MEQKQIAGVNYRLAFVQENVPALERFHIATLILGTSGYKLPLKCLENMEASTREAKHEEKAHFDSDFLGSKPQAP